MARPTKYTEDTVKRLEYAIGLGAPYTHACRYADIGESTFHEWRANNPEFAERLEKAAGKAAVGWLRKIETAATAGNWQAAAWKLERRYPAEFGRREAVELTGEVKHSGDFKELTTEEIRTAVLLGRKMTAALAPPEPPAPGTNGHGTNGHHR